MSKPINPMAIGGFLIGGLALLITALLVFGGGQLFKPKLYWVVYFDSSLNGLNVGAPVKVQGVQVGTVKELVLQMDLKNNRLMKPVVLEIEPGSLVNPQGEVIQSALTEEASHERLKALIDSGLRARLEIQSLLTGLLYVDLDFYPNYEARLTGFNYKDYPEVPAIPTTVDEVKSALEEVVTKIKDMPLDSMVRDLSATLAEIRSIVASDETRQSREAL
ncbi:MlaD family protein, partial [Methylomagnum sp.]